MTKITMPVAKINQLRRRAGMARKVPQDLPEGWSKSKIDPGAVTGVFNTLCLTRALGRATIGSEA
jgi:hypothetical protein